MPDEGIAAVSPASVYNVLKRHHPGKDRQPPKEEEAKGFVQPVGIHEQRHLDFSYIRIAGAFYYFISILDGYSRKILVWDWCETMDGINAEVLVAKAKELFPLAMPRIISDNGGQFCSKDFRELIALLEFEQTFTSANHPQSNGKLERFHRTFKTEHVRQSAYFGYADAKDGMKCRIDYHDTMRLHSAIWYLPPEDVFQGRVEKRLAERGLKLHTAFIDRRSYWQNQNAALGIT
jgi:transposase InsO family protein